MADDYERLENWLIKEFGDDPSIYFDSDNFQKATNKAIDDLNAWRATKGWGPVSKENHVLTANQGNKNLRYWRELLQEDAGFDIDSAGSSVADDVRSMTFEKVSGLSDEEIRKLIFKKTFTDSEAESLVDVSKKESFVMKKDLRKQIAEVRKAMSERAISVVNFDDVRKQVVDSLDETDDTLFSSLEPSIRENVIKNRLLRRAGVKSVDIESLPELRESLDRNAKAIVSKYRDYEREEREDELRIKKIADELQKARKDYEARATLESLVRPSKYREKIKEVEEQGKSLTRIAGGFKAQQTIKGKKVAKFFEEFF